MRKRDHNDDFEILPLLKRNRKIRKKTNGNKELKIYMVAENLFDTYFNKRIIDQDQWEAAQMYYECWYHGVYNPLGVSVSRMTPPKPKNTGCKTEPNDFFIESKEKYYEYCLHVGRVGRKILDAVCFGTLANEVEKENGWVRCYANERMCEALDDLCYHIGLKKQPVVN